MGLVGGHFAELGGEFDGVPQSENPVMRTRVVLHPAYEAWWRAVVAPDEALRWAKSAIADLESWLKSQD